MTIVGSALAQITQGGSEQRWADRLHAASFRGVPFAVISGESQSGRRQAVHEYPMRDQVWVEDLGRGTRRITLQGFIVQDSRIYGGGDVIAQRDSLVAASETGGAGTLVHPTLGELTVNIPDGGLKIREGMDQGRSFSFSLTCIESGLKTFALTTGGITGSTVEQSWFSTVTTAAAAIIAEVKGEILSIKHAATTIQNTLSFWSSFVSDTAREATTLASSLRSTLGNMRFGRDCNGSAGGSISGLTRKITPGFTDTADGNGEFTDGNVAGNVQPTELMAAWFNSVQRELLAVLKEAGITPDKTNDAQLIEAIQQILATGIAGSGYLISEKSLS